MVMFAKVKDMHMALSKLMDDGLGNFTVIIGNEYSVVIREDFDAEHIGKVEVNHTLETVNFPALSEIMSLSEIT